MKRCLLIILSVLWSLALLSDTPQNEYIRKYAPTAVSEMHRSGVPASITLAQGMLESRYGLSSLAAEGNNHFGIKCHRNWKGKTMRVNDDAPNECFRVYKSADESFRDHSDFLRYQDRYKTLFELDPSDYKGWARGLKKAGYATDPKYADKLISLIEEYKLYIYDGGGEASGTAGPGRSLAASVPESPLKIEKKARVEIKPRENYSFSLSRKVYRNNGIMCVYAEQGDTFESIALEFNLFNKEILRFNDLSASRPLRVGEVVYLKPKKRQAAYGLPMYVADGTPVTVWGISQRFGIRMKNLLKWNPGLEASYAPVEGDVIYLKKIK